MRNPASLLFRGVGRVWSLLAIAVLLLGSASVWGSLSPTPAKAAPGDELRIKSAKVSVWPEYDDPRLLVIYEGEFADGGTFPRDVQFKAPLDATIQMACALTPKKEHQCQVYDTAVEGDFKVISFKLPIPTFYFEYYAGGIEGATDKTISYNFVNPPYTVDSLSLEIQQPLKATNFTINPSSAAVSTDNQGFKYYNYNLSSVPADKALIYAVSYTKSDSKPSVEKQQAGSTAGQTNNSLIILASVGGMAAVLVASYWLANKRNQQKRYAERAMATSRMRQPERNVAPTRPPSRPVSGARPAARTAAPPRPAPSAPSVAIFCSNCGTQLEADDSFCFNCGGPVKRKGDGALGKRR